ncbi:MAG: hypothetical protein LBG78_06075 [Azoarcus sp.]|jgi:hypothetical protein|nr:hypothetical protein [Azoarcus sp.]
MPSPSVEVRVDTKTKNNLDDHADFTKTLFHAVFVLVKHAKSFFIVAIFLVGCDAQNNDQKLIENFLHSNAEIGSVTKLSSLGLKAADTVCVLHPYQRTLIEEHPEKQRIDTYLRSIDFRTQEWSWSLVILRDNNISLSKFRRSNDADIANSFILDRLMKNSPLLIIPADFEIAECAQFERSSLLKISVTERNCPKNCIYYVFGRTK